MNTPTSEHGRGQKAGGIAAIYLALALLAAMPYFLLVVDYPGAITAADRLALVVGNYSSMYAMYLVTYVFFGIALGVLSIALHDRLSAAAPFASRIATAIGLLWSFALVTSGMVFTYGMTAITGLAATDRAQAVVAWQAIEPIALALGGAGGELLGALWVLMVSAIGFRGGVLSKGVSLLGAGVGVLGLVSVVPPLHDAAMGFGLLQIAWLMWMGVSTLKSTTAQVRVAESISSRRDPAGAPMSELRQSVVAATGPDSSSDTAVHARA